MFGRAEGKVGAEKTWAYIETETRVKENKKVTKQGEEVSLKDYF